MPELVFADGRLLEGESELARVDAGASIFSGGRDYGIYRTSKHGWRYAVKAVTAASSAPLSPSACAAAGVCESARPSCS